MKYENFLRSYFARPLSERMTICELAKVAGVSKNVICAAKKGRQVSTRTLEKLLAVLGGEITVSQKGAAHGD